MLLVSLNEELSIDGEAIDAEARELVLERIARRKYRSSILRLNLLLHWSVTARRIRNLRGRSQKRRSIIATTAFDDRLGTVSAATVWLLPWPPHVRGSCQVSGP
jgi:hypothetical protein